MLTQWECFLRNLGTWEGLFTNFSQEGEELQNIPSNLVLEGFDNNQKAILTLRRFPENEPENKLVLEFTSLNKSILFFETGAFSQGSMYYSPFSQFGAEFGLVFPDRRLRLVQMYNRESELENITLIREKAPHSQTPERPALTVEQLLGEWQGYAITLYPDLRKPDIYQTNLKINRQNNNYLVQTLSFGKEGKEHSISSTARIDGNVLRFEDNPLSVQILMLPDGASCNCPKKIKPQIPFVLELGRLITPNQRQRIIRSYSEKGEWISLTLVTEEKI